MLFKVFVPPIYWQSGINTGQEKSYLFQLDVNLFPNKPETRVLVDSPMTEGNRWGAILAGTCFFFYKLY